MIIMISALWLYVAISHTMQLLSRSRSDLRTLCIEGGIAIVVRANRLFPVMAGSCPGRGLMGSGPGGRLEILSHGPGHRVIGAQVALAVGQRPLQQRDDLHQPSVREV